ncbi:MAG: HAD family hydrolase, partial [Mycobacterium sp.]
ALHQDAGVLAVAAQPAWRIETADGTLTVYAADHDHDDLSIVRAVADAIWSGQFNGHVTIEAGDDTARAALQRWALA